MVADIRIERILTLPANHAYRRRLFSLRSRRREARSAGRAALHGSSIPPVPADCCEVPTLAHCPPAQLNGHRREASILRAILRPPHHGVHRKLYRRSGRTTRTPRSQCRLALQRERGRPVAAEATRRRARLGCLTGHDLPRPRRQERRVTQ